MKAIQITAPSEMKVVDIEKPELKPGEVLVKIKDVIRWLICRLFRGTKWEALLKL